MNPTGGGNIPPVTTPPSRLPVLGKYRILDLLGEGAVGQVFLCEQTEPIRRRVAVKVLKPGMNSRTIAARFRFEQQMLALMHHPNIAHLLDAGETAHGEPYFVLEYVPGVPLTDYCRENALALRARLGIFLQVCAAVHHAHQKGVIHRDLKPSNILVTEHDGTVRPVVIDFGISDAVLPGMDTPSTEGFGGSPEYMSPEQADFESRHADTRSDIYSLGVLLYELITGTTPLGLRDTAISLTELRHALSEVRPEPPSRRLARANGTANARLTGAESVRELAMRVAGDLDSVTLKALAKEPSRRYATAADFAADIQHCLDRRPVTARPMTRGYLLRKFAQRHLLAVTIITTLSLTLLAFTSVSLWQAHALRVARDAAAYQAEASQQAADLLVNVLTLTEWHGHHADTALRAAVDAGAQRAMADLRQFPEMRAELLHTIARVYNALGEYLRAETLLQEALDDSSLNATQRLRLANELARAQVAQDKFDAAEAHLLTVAGSAAADRSDSLDAQLQIGRLYRERARNAEARAVFENVIALTEGEPAFDELRGRALLGLGNLLLDSGEFEAADAPLQQAQTLIVATRGADSEAGLDVREAVAYRLLMLGKYEEALHLYEEVLSSTRRVYGEVHHATAVAWNDVGMVYMYLDDFAHAEPAYLRALEIHREVHGEEHSETLRVVANLAGLYGKHHMMDRAVPLFEQALAARTRLFGGESDEVLRTLLNYGFAHNEADGFAEGETLLRKAHAGYTKLYGAEHWLTLTAQNGVGQSLLGQARFAEAEATLCEAYLALQRTLGEDHPRSVLSREYLDELRATWPEARRSCQ